MAHLTLDGVTKRFGETVAVDNVSIEVADGEFLVLVGPSGCGKTTTLRILAGLEEATEGRVAIGGEDVTEVRAKDRNLAMVFQSYALYPHMTVGETIGFALRLQGRTKTEISAAVVGAAERLEIAHLLDRKPRELSGGQRQRVAVARCIVREPHAFLFDEPLSNLDAKLRSSARVEISKLQKSLGVTSVYVTHDQVEAMTMADRIVLMDQGRIRQIGAPMDLYRDPDDMFVASFLGAPAMNMIEGRFEGGAFTAGEVRVPLPENGYAGPATLGVRPEALSLAQSPTGVPIKARVTHTEQLGAETILEIQPSDPALPVLKSRQPENTAAPRDKAALTVFVAPTSTLLFDSDGRRLRQPHRA